MDAFVYLKMENHSYEKNLNESITLNDPLRSGHGMRCLCLLLNPTKKVTKGIEMLLF